MTDGVAGLNGRALAEAAHPVCREVDPDGAGLALDAIEGALLARGVAIAGKNPRSTLGTALNGHQDLFEWVSYGVWRWHEPSFDPEEGLSGIALAEEAYLVLSRHDPQRTGLHYGRIRQILTESGIKIRGGNPGNTLFTALSNADQWFEWVSSGTFRLK